MTFNTIRDVVNGTAGFDLWPAYWRFLAHKPLLRPNPMPDVEEGGMKTIVPMQPLLEHTVMRTLDIPKYKNRVLEADAKSKDIQKPLEYIAYAKIGVDGFSGLSKYNQALPAGTQDGKLIASELILMQVVARADQDPKTDISLYMNPLVNSPEAPRPLW